MELKDRLIELRQQNGMSQGDVADALYLTRQSVSRWETGCTIPSTDNLRLLSQLYGVSLDELMNCGETRELPDPPAKPAPAAKAKPETGRRSFRLILASAALVLAILGAVIGAYYFGKGESDAEVTEAYNLYELNETDVPDVDNLNILPWSEK